MQEHNAHSIKSLEGFRRAWVEEAQSLSPRSLALLRPTIRAEGSEIWASWNPRRKSDAIDEFLRAKRPDNAMVVNANWRDNPFFPPVLEEERQLDLRLYPETYGHLEENIMSTGGGTTTTSTVQQSAPWEPAQPYLTDLLNQAQQTYYGAQGATAMPSDVAPFSPVTQQALNATAQRAATGSPLVSAADNATANLLNGNGPGSAAEAYFTNPANINPYLNAQFSAASQPVIDAVNAQFGLAGRTGSGANQQELTRDLGQLAGSIYGSGYENAANRAVGAAGALNSQSLAAAGQAPQLASQDYADLQNLLNVGGAYDAQTQAQLNDQLQQWQYAQQQPWNILQAYSGDITGLGSLGGTSSGTSSQRVPGQSLIPSLIGSAAYFI
jgi:hypothetical protein